MIIALFSNSELGLETMEGIEMMGGIELFAAFHGDCVFTSFLHRSIATPIIPGRINHTFLLFLLGM